MASAPPFRIAPQFVRRVWGWTSLEPWFPYSAQEDPVGEVWLTGDDCLVETGPWAGRRLGSLFADYSHLLLGPAANAAGSPLLVKVLFAREKLSVQVHPGDEMARKYGAARGKTECWYALAADPGAQVACGVKPGVTAAEIRASIQDGTLERNLNAIPIVRGDMVFVDAGTVHAIWPGSVILETQQNCDITYRMFDYGRPRELHVDKSLEAMRLTTNAGKVAPRPLPDRDILVDAEHFRVERISAKRSITGAALRAADAAPDGLSYLFASAGSGAIVGGFDRIELPTNGIVAVPACTAEFAVESGGDLDIVRMVAK